MGAYIDYINTLLHCLQLLDKSNNTIKGVHSTALQKANSYFKACMNSTATEKRGNRPMLEVSKLLIYNLIIRCFTNTVNTVSNIIRGNI